MFAETLFLSFSFVKPNENFINLHPLASVMDIKNRKWLLLVSLLAIIGVSLIIFFSIFESPRYRAPWGPPRYPGMIPSYILWASFALLIFAIVPISYYFISRRLEEKLEKNMKIISKLVSKTNQVSKKEPREISNKNIILRLLNSDEREVLEKLIEGKGTVLQSEISRTEGMTKLKAHRAVKDLERKGIIKTESHGKTNRITLTKDIKDIMLG